MKCKLFFVQDDDSHYTRILYILLKLAFDILLKENCTGNCFTEKHELIHFNFLSFATGMRGLHSTIFQQSYNHMNLSFTTIF